MVFGSFQRVSFGGVGDHFYNFGIGDFAAVNCINYRLQGTRYIVDGLFDQAVLTMDVGSDQQRVVIERKE